MKRNFKQIITLVQCADQLNEQERLAFFSWLVWADDRDLKPILELIKRDARFARFIFENIQMKQKAVQSHNSTAWEQIVKGEVDILQM